MPKSVKLFVSAINNNIYLSHIILYIDTYNVYNHVYIYVFGHTDILHNYAYIYMHNYIICMHIHS